MLQGGGAMVNGVELVVMRKTTVRKFTSIAPHLSLYCASPFYRFPLPPSLGKPSTKELGA